MPSTMATVRALIPRACSQPRVPRRMATRASAALRASPGNSRSCSRMPSTVKAQGSSNPTDYFCTIYLQNRLMGRPPVNALRLTLRQLQIFRAVAESGSTAAAAAAISLSQSATSAAINELERTLELQLFDRIGKRLQLNDNGRALLPQT